MIERIKDYAIFILLLLLGIAGFVIGRRGDKIKDLQADIIKRDLTKQLDKAQDLVTGDKQAYDDAVNNYIAKRDRYNRLFKGNNPHNGM